MLREMFLKGQITRFHQVSTDGTTWRQFQEWPGLMPPDGAPMAASAPPEAPAGAVGLRRVAAVPTPAAAPAPVAGTPAEWYVDRDGRQMGPFSLLDLRAMTAAGQLPRTARVRQGPAGEWRPLAEVAEVTGGPANATGPLPEALAGEPAGFGRRCAAALLDALVAGLANGCVAVAMALAGRSPADLGVRGLVVAAVVEAYFAWIYSAVAESSARQGTLGKMAVGIRVTDLQGRRLTLGRASGRFAAKLLSGLTLGLGFLPAAFGERHQALHDRVAGTLVLR
jgi:uncharacterized RDD family membrane protein YckC